MALAIEKYDFLNGTGSYTFDGSGTNRAVIVFGWNEHTVGRPLNAITINSVTPDMLVSNINNHDGGNAGTLAMAIWLEANHPGSGAQTLAATWQATVDSNYAIIELSGACQTPGQLIANIRTDTSTGNAYNVLYTLAADVVNNSGEMGFCVVGLMGGSTLTTAPTIADAGTNLTATKASAFGTQRGHLAMGYDASLSSDTVNLGLDITNTYSGDTIDTTCFAAFALRDSDFVLPDGPVIEGWTSWFNYNDINDAKVVVPKNVADGDVLIYVVGNDEAGGVEDYDDSTEKPSGFTLIGVYSENAADTQIAAFYKEADGTEGGTTITTTYTNADQHVPILIHLSNADVTGGTDVLGADETSSPLAMSAVTTTTDNALAIAAFSHDGTDGLDLTTDSAGWNVLFSGGESRSSGNSAVGVATKLVPSAGTSGAITVTGSGDGMVGFIFAIAALTQPGGAAYPYQIHKHKKGGMNVLLTM